MRGFLVCCIALISFFKSGSAAPLVDMVFKDNIKTVLLYKEGWELSQPVIELNSNERVILRFDELGSNANTYNYTVLHCDSEWKESSLSTFDYLDGFFQNQIQDYSFSMNTYYNYVHYQLAIPNEDLSLKLSGNYLLKVYEDGNPDRVVLQKRFRVVQTMVNIQARVGMPSIPYYQDHWQKVDFTILHEELPIADPLNDIKVVINQNNRWDNEITGLKPLFIRHKELVYHHEDGNLFLGGNEFRAFDTKNTRYQAPSIRQIIYQAPYFHFSLYPDSRRDNRPYFFNEDINGKYLVNLERGRDPQVEADYVHVHFSVPADERPLEGDLHVFGALTNWTIHSSNRMKYNPENKALELNLLLKQGYYNYLYTFVKTGATDHDPAWFEGNSSETENDYTIYVYYKPFGSRHDQLVGVRFANTLMQQ
jgi:hypothetical protein